MRTETGATAGATLIPMVMNAQITAAKADTTFVFAYCAIMFSFFDFPDHSGHANHIAQAMPNRILSLFSDY